MGGIAPLPKHPGCYSIILVAVTTMEASLQEKADSENMTKREFPIKANENVCVNLSAIKREKQWNENGYKPMSNYRLVRGCSRLMYACQHGLKDSVLHELRSKPEQIRKRDKSNKSVLHYCTGQSDIMAAASIAVAAPDLLQSADEDGFTPLHLAVIQGNLAMVNLLLANKADVNAVDNEGHSVVHWATVCGEVEALRSVLQAGANVKTPDINGGTPLHYAAQMCGANYESKLGPATSSKLAVEVLDILLSHPQSSVDINDKDGRKPLLWAASAGSAIAVIALVKAGSRIESADKDGLTALHCAASRGHTECIDTLISLCGAQTDLIDSNGCTALHYAVTLGHADATARLLDLEADPNRQDRKGRTPAHCGCSKGQFETVKILKEWGANLWLRNAKGDLPLHEAASSGRRELVEWFLEQKPKQVNTTSNDGRSLLHISASNDNADICKLLLDYGADVNSILRNSRGVSITPLDCALQKGFRSTAKFLQSNGGLPASKLHLSTRNCNAFNVADQVQPIKYTEIEELQKIKDSKKYVLYSNHSESESGEHCSCNEHFYKKERMYKHTCKHHKNKFRRRTSSCGEAKHIYQENSCRDICRSKSNTEIHRKKSCEHVFTSESELDSCENCCHHRKKHKLLKRKERTSRRTRVVQDFIRNSSKKPHQEEKENEKFLQPNAKLMSDSLKRPTSLSSSKTSNNNQPQSPKKKQSDDKVIYIPPMQPMAMSLTDEDVENSERADQVVVTQADIHTSPEPQAHSTTDIFDNISTLLHHREPEVGDVEVSSKQINKDLEPAVKTAPENGIKNKENKSKINDGHATNNDTEPIAENPETIIENTSCYEPPILVTKQNNANEQGIIRFDSNTQGAESNLIPNLQLATEPPRETLQQLESDDGDKDSEKDLHTLGDSKKNQENPSIQVENCAMKDERANLNNDISQPNIENIISNEVVVITSIDEQPSKSTVSNQRNQSIEITKPKQSNQSPPLSPKDKTTQSIRGDESRRSFTLLPDSHAELEDQLRKSSFQVLKSDESVDVDDAVEQMERSNVRIVPIVSNERPKTDFNGCVLSSDGEVAMDDGENNDGVGNSSTSGNRVLTSLATFPAVANNTKEHNIGRKRRQKKRIKSGGTRGRNLQKLACRTTKTRTQLQHPNKDQDSGFEPSPRGTRTKIPSPRNTCTHEPRKAIYTSLDGRYSSIHPQNRKPGDKGTCDMSAVTRSIQRNIRRYYMERKIFQHLLELKSLQIRTNKLNEAVLVKRAVDEYHKSCFILMGETGTTLRRYPFSEFTFRNFEMFLYETLKSLQRPGTFNFQNINEVYEEAERRLSPDYNAYEKALQCTTKTHRCFHAAHAYTGIPCAAYIPMMNHHTMPKFGFEPYKKAATGSFYLPKILSSNYNCGSKVSLELSNGKNKQLISLPSEKLDSNKRYYVTFTVKDSGGKQQTHEYHQQKEKEEVVGDTCGEKSLDLNKNKREKDEK